tara:strand:- start:3411 stop:4286 length:876 start_codon:yes stop_codon:yes gene_type:complete
MKKKSVAILLAAFNGEKYITEQIHSLINQRNVDITIYISVDKSSDLTLSIVEQFVNEYPTLIKLLPYGDSYGSAGANFYRLIKDVDLTLHNYVSFSDQDDYWLPWKLISAISKIENHGFDAYSSNAIAYWPKKKTMVIVKSQPQKKYDYIYESAGHGCTYVFTSDSLIEFKNVLVEKYEKSKSIELHDWLIYAFYRNNDMKWIIDTELSILYRQHSNNEVGVNLGIKQYLNRVQKVSDGWYKKQIAKNLVFLDIDDNRFLSSMWMMTNIKELRRRPRDRFALFLFVLFKFI